MNHSELLNTLEEYWDNNPNLRLGQILSNASIDINHQRDPFYVSDKAFMEWLKDHEN